MKIAQLLVSMLLALTVTQAPGALAKKSAPPAAAATSTAAPATSTGNPDKIVAPTPEEVKKHPSETWVKGYTKKDGTKVEGYWRKKPGAKK